MNESLPPFGLSPPGPNRGDRAVSERRCADAERARRLEHDLRTPIGTLAAAWELLGDSCSDAALQAEARAVIERQLARLHALADELHAFAASLDTE